MKAGLVPGPEPQYTQIDLIALMILHVARMGRTIKRRVLFALQQAGLASAADALEATALAAGWRAKILYMSTTRHMSTTRRSRFARPSPAGPFDDE
jgi:hypothetical protein